MAKYLLIEFDNDAQCDALMEKLREKKTFRAVGLFKKPTKFCECPMTQNRQMGRETARGSRFGWWVHITCSRALRAPQAPRNLLEPIDTPAKHRDIFLHLNNNYPLTIHRIS